MTPDERRSRLRKQVQEAQARRARSRAEAEARKDSPPRAGDVYVLPSTAQQAVLWALLDTVPSSVGQHFVLQHVVAVAADLHPWVGSADVAVPSQATCGALTLRCGFEVELDAEDLATARGAGSLPPDVLEAARHKRAELHAGRPIGSVLERDTDGDPEYQDWLREGPARAQAALRRDLRERRRAQAQAPDAPTPPDDLPREEVHASAIDAVSGRWLTPPASSSQVLVWAKEEAVDLGVLHLLQHVDRMANQPHLGASTPSDVRDLAQNGWAVVFHQAETAETREALRPLIDHRRGQAGETHTKILEYRSGEDWRTWLSRHGVAPGRVQPGKVPYFLLLVGSPEEIPYTFQCLLGVEYAVGRLSFETPQELHQYAQGLVHQETRPHLPGGRTAVYFAPQPFPGAETGAEDATPLPDLATRAGWRLDRLEGEEATKGNLVRVLERPQGRPATFLLTMTQGLAWPHDHPEQAHLQGSLLCHGWPGEGPVHEEHRFAAADLGPSAQVEGSIVFLQGSYSAGASAGNDLEAAPIDPSWTPARSFVAALPRRLLSHPRGAAGAVIGCIGRHGWPEAGSSPHALPFADLLQGMADGQAVGHALRKSKMRYAALATQLAVQLEKVRLGAQVDEAELARLWGARNNARNVIVLGDPAVCLQLDTMEINGNLS